MHSEQEILQKRLAQFLIRDVFNTISEDDILSKVGPQWTHRGIPLQEGTIKVLKREAETFKKTSLYPLLISELRFHARNGLEKAETEADIISSKLLAYFVDMIESKVKKIAEL
jgi:hypothetical protein